MNEDLAPQFRWNEKIPGQLDVFIEVEGWIQNKVERWENEER